MEDAKLLNEGDRPVIRFERRLSQPPDEVWTMLTDPNELSSWFPCDIVATQWKEGAQLRFVFRRNEGPEMSGTVLEVDEPRLLTYTWGDETLRFELAPGESGGTMLIFTDELDPGIAARNAAGWVACLEALAGGQPSHDA